QADGQRKGNPSELDDGPVKNRSCRDVICLLFFVAFFVFFGVVIVWAATVGDLDRLLHGYDKSGNVCGRKTNPTIAGVNGSGQDTSGKPYLRTCGIGVTCGSEECVTQCSNTETLVLNRCLPISTGATSAATKDAGNFFMRVGASIQATWREIVYMCLIALVFSLVITIMFRFLTGVVVWLILIVGSLACIAGTIALWILWNNEKQANGANEKYYLIGAIAATIFTVILLLVLLVMRSRIALVVALFREAGKALHSIPFLFLQPLWTFIALAIFLFIWGLGALLIQSTGDPTVNSDGIVKYNINGFFAGMRWYHLFALFWGVQFIIACQHVVIAGAIAVWYFTRSKKLGFPIFRSTWNLLRYSIGSVALGSFIIALIQLIRYLLSRLQQRLKGSTALSCCLCCCQCLLSCFENFLKFLNRNAYIEIAIYGYSFCKAAREAFKLLTTNALRMVAINTIGDFVLFLGKVAVVVPIVFIGIKLVGNRDGVEYPWAPVVVGAVFAFIIAHAFIAVYEVEAFEMAVDTLFLCFCEDVERNDGVNRPYYMSKGLMEFVENSKQAMAALDARKRDKGA
ncbi:unnamed protein product, partial [Darwinula stevensoni]